MFSGTDDVFMSDLSFFGASTSRLRPDLPYSASQAFNTKQQDPSIASLMDPLTHNLEVRRELSTKEKLLAVVDEVEVIYDTLLSLLLSHPIVSSDPSITPLIQNISSVSPNVDLSSARTPLDLGNFERSVQEITSLLAERQLEFNKLVLDAVKEAEIELAIQGLIGEADKLKDQVMALQSRLKEAEQILANALHMTKQKTESIKAADDAQLSLEEIIRYAHRISVGFSAAAPPNWLPGDPRRPYPTEMEMRAGALSKLSADLPPPSNQSLALPTKNLVDVTQQFLGSNAGPFTMSPQPLGQGPTESPKTSIAGALQRETSADEQDVETMSSDSSSSSSSEEE